MIFPTLEHILTHISFSIVSIVPCLFLLCLIYIFYYINIYRKV